MACHDAADRNNRRLTWGKRSVDSLQVYCFKWWRVERAVVCARIQGARGPLCPTPRMPFFTAAPSGCPNGHAQEYLLSPITTPRGQGLAPLLYCIVWSWGVDPSLFSVPLWSSSNSWQLILTLNLTLSVASVEICSGKKITGLRRMGLDAKISVLWARQTQWPFWLNSEWEVRALLEQCLTIVYLWKTHMEIIWS